MAFRSAIGPIQASIYAWLAADATFMGLIKGVFDQVPESKDFPYVEFEDFKEVPDNVLGDQGRQITVTLLSWSQALGFLELENIMEELWRLLDENTVGDVSPSQGWHIYQSLISEADMSKEPDGITRKGTVKAEIFCQKVALGS